MAEDNNTDTDTDIENLTTLKFNLEKQIETIDNRIFFTSNDVVVKKILKNYMDSQEMCKIKQYQLELKFHLKEIEAYLETNCAHDWVDDVVEHGLDNSKEIRYCKKCFSGY